MLDRVAKRTNAIGSWLFIPHACIHRKETDPINMIQVAKAGPH